MEITKEYIENKYNCTVVSEPLWEGGKICWYAKAELDGEYQSIAMGRNLEDLEKDILDALEEM